MISIKCSEELLSSPLHSRHGTFGVRPLNLIFAARRNGYSLKAVVIVAAVAAWPSLRRRSSCSAVASSE